MLSAPPPGETVAPSGPVRYRPAADPALRALVSVVWRTEVAPESQTVRVLPDAAVDLVITADRIAVAGPDTGPSVERLPAGPVVGLQVRPEAVPALLGVPASALLDARTEIADLWGAPGEWLTDRARGAATLRSRVAVVEEALAARACRTTLLPHVAGLRELVASVGRLDPVDLGVGERQLRRRCVAAFGYGPRCWPASCASSEPSTTFARRSAARSPRWRCGPGTSTSRTWRATSGSSAGSLPPAFARHSPRSLSPDLRRPEGDCEAVARRRASRGTMGRLPTSKGCVPMSVGFASYEPMDSRAAGEPEDAAVAHLGRRQAGPAHPTPHHRGRSRRRAGDVPEAAGRPPRGRAVDDRRHRRSPGRRTTM